MPPPALHLSVAPDLERFRPELEYACRFVEQCYRLDEGSAAAPAVHYGDDPPEGAVHCPAVLFPDGVRLDAAGIHPERAVLARMEAGSAGRLLPPEAPRPGADPARDGCLPYDALGLVFLALSRLEERDPPATDRYGRFPVRESLAWRTGTLLDPLADRAALDVACALTRDPRPEARSRYEVLLTHDVDRVRGYHRPIEPLRNAAGDVVKRRDLGAAWRRLRVGYLSNLPWSSFREIMDLSERHGYRSRFYFMGPSELSNDSPYVLTMPDLTRRLAVEVASRGHVVGFHPGYAAFDDPAEWRRQRQGLESVIGLEVVEGRQHTLRYDTTVTPRIWEENGMEMDCTPSYPESTGFRSGTCRAYFGYDLVERRPLRLRQHSTAVMDFGLFGGKYRALTVDEALDEARAAADVCRRYQGALVVLYHVGQVLAPERDFYHAMLDAVA